MVFGLARKSKYEEVQKQNDELKAYMNVLIGQVETLRREVAELRKETRASKQRNWQLRKETCNLRVQKEGLADSVEILTNEREIFQNTIQNLWQATRKQSSARALIEQFNCFFGLGSFILKIHFFLSHILSFSFLLFLSTYKQTQININSTRYMPCLL